MWPFQSGNSNIDHLPGISVQLRQPACNKCNPQLCSPRLWNQYHFIPSIGETHIVHFSIKTSLSQRFLCRHTLRKHLPSFHVCSAGQISWINITWANWEQCIKELPPPRFSGNGSLFPAVNVSVSVCVQFPGCKVDFCCNYSVYNQLFVSWFWNMCHLVYLQSAERKRGVEKERWEWQKWCVRVRVCVRFLCISGNLASLFFSVSQSL